MMSFRNNKRDGAAADNNESFVEQNKRMKTGHGKEYADPGHKYLWSMLYARSLCITWADGGHNYWIWHGSNDASNGNLEVAELSHVCWLDVRGKFKMSDCLAGALYEVVFQVMLTNGASGWQLPINLRLSLPNGAVQERQLSLLQMPRGQWMELNVGEFRTEENGEMSSETEVCFHLYEHGGHWKSGLVIMGAILRPKS